jgi:hypothetical protein
MKPIIWTLTVSILFSAIASGYAEDREVVVWTDHDDRAKAITEFIASGEDAEKVAKWRPGDADLISLESLVGLAKKRAKPPEGEPKFKSSPELMSVIWMPSSGGGWIAMVRLLFLVDAPADKVLLDGLATVDILMLPNGAPIKKTTRAMNHEELLKFGLVEPTSEEAKEIRKKWTGPEAFAPGTPTKN